MRGDYKWTPKLNLIRAEFNIPSDVTLRVWPDDHDIKSGEGLKEGEIIFSCKHFSAIRFPLHPLIHNFFYRLNLTPVQVHPNSLRILSSALVLNIIKGWDLNLSDIFNCYKVSAIKDEHGFFHLASLHKRAIVCGNPTSEKRWKEQLLIVGGNWSAPELHLQPIRTTFGRPAHPAFSKLDKKRIQFLGETVLSCTHNSSTLLKDHYLLEVSRRRIGWEGLDLDSATQAAAAAIVISSESRGATETSGSSEAAAEVAEVNSSTMRKLPTAPLPSLKKSSIKSTLNPIEMLQKSFETRISEQCDPKKKRMSTLSISPACKDGDYYASDQSHKQKALYMENNPMMENWRPNLIKADGKSILKGDSIEDDPEVCLALARCIWTPRDDLKIVNATASEFSSNAPVKIMQGLYCTLGLCKKVDAYEVKIKKLESDLAKAEAKAEEADRRQYESENPALDKTGDAMQGKERADAKSAKLLKEIEEMKNKVNAYEMKIKNLQSDLVKAEAKAEEADRRRHEDEKSALAKIGDAMQRKERADAKSAKLMNEIEQIKKKASETEALKKRINQLLKDKEETYKKYSNQVLEESAKSFRAGWFEALKDDAEKTYPNPDAFDVACGFTPGQYLEDDDVSSSLHLSKY